MTLYSVDVLDKMFIRICVKIDLVVFLKIFFFFNLRSAAFARLSLPQPIITNNSKDINNIVVDNEDVFDNEDIFDNEDDVDTEIDTSDNCFSENETLFDIIINPSEYKKMQPIIKEYKGRERLVLQPGVWGDIVADAVWRQTSIRCAYSSKCAPVSRNSDSTFVKIKGHCISKKCNATFFCVTKREPSESENFLLKVRARDTSCFNHEKVTRQLRNEKRRALGEKVVIEGAANCQRRIAREVMCPGDAPAPILYSLPVLRKLRQETQDKQLGLTSEDSKNPILTLQKLKFTPPYIGSIHSIGLDDVFVHVFTPEMIQVMKEYSRFFGLDAESTMDSSGGLIDNITVHPGISSGHIFATEIIISISAGIVG